MLIKYRFSYIRLFLQGFGAEMNELPEVLLDKVMVPELLKDSGAASTGKTYHRRFLRWRKWAINTGLGVGDTFPAKALHVAIYLASTIQTAISPSPVISAFYSIKCHHDLVDLKSPTDSKLVSNIMEAGKRRLARPVINKEPETIKMLSDMFYSLHSEGNVKNQRIICACLVAYAGFLRSEELLKTKRSDILIDSIHMRGFIESSKTDKYKEGAWILISRTSTNLRPVVNTARYFEWLNVDENDSIPMLCNLSTMRDGYKMRKDKKPISYTTLRELFINAFRPHVDDISKYGATAAANCGIADRLFKRHGRWISESDMDM